MADLQHERRNLRRLTWLFLILFLLACALWRLSYVPLVSLGESPAVAVAGRIVGWTWIDVALALLLLLGFLAGHWWARAMVVLLLSGNTRSTQG